MELQDLQSNQGHFLLRVLFTVWNVPHIPDSETFFKERVQQAQIVTFDLCSVHPEK